MTMTHLARLTVVALPLSLGLSPTLAHAQPAAPAASDGGEVRRPSLATSEPLGTGRAGMSIGGGVAVLFPFYLLEAGYGVGARVDVVARFETVLGVLHYPSLGVRWAFGHLFGWTLGASATGNWSFFGVDSGQTNLSSAIYLGVDLAASRPITRGTDLLFGFTNEIDLYRYRIADGDGKGAYGPRWDAAILRTGIRTQLTEDLDGYLRMRIRIPEETVRYEAQKVYVIPAIELGGTWTF
jgi:hypothetical protein